MKTKTDRLLDAAERRLGEALASSSWSLAGPAAIRVPGERSPGSGTREFWLERAGERVLLLLRASVGSVGFDTLRRALADGLVTGRAAAAGERYAAMVVATPITDAMVERLGAFRHWIDPDAGWGAVDPEGPVLLEFGADRIIGETAPGRAVARRQDAALRPFTDQGQWILKVLLAPRIDPSLLHADRSSAATDATLAEHAGVSATTLSRVLSSLEGLDHLDRSGGERRLKRLPALFRAWRSALPAVVDELPCRVASPRSDPLPDLLAAVRRSCGVERSEPGSRVALALFAACRLLGVGHVRGVPTHLYHEDPRPETLEALGLAPVEAGERADVLVRRPTVPESIFRGAVEIDGVLVCDALQCWLDVVDHPLRGEEQAEELWIRLGLSEGGAL